MTVFHSQVGLQTRRFVRCVDAKGGDPVKPRGKGKPACNSGLENCELRLVAYTFTSVQRDVAKTAT